jgi:SPX domain protein involved in polyphosphate accumulation
MYIQYVGFNVAASSRIYNFDVLDTREEAREFTVKVQSEAFRPARLKLQDGPGICFERLEQELERETQKSRAEAHLSIRERDIQEYLEGRYPRKPSWQRKQHRITDPSS